MGKCLPSPCEDSILNCWITAWDIRHLYEGWSGYWNGNIFFPSRGTLAFSENLLGSLPIALPLYLLSRNIIFVHNALLLLSFPLTGIGMFLFSYRITKDGVASFFAGLFFAFAPYRMAHIFHLNLLTMQWIPFALLFWYDSIKGGRLRSLILFSLFFLLQFMSCIHYGLFLSLLFPLLTVIIYWKEKDAIPGRRFLLLALSWLVTILLLLPFYIQYSSVRQTLGMLNPPSPLWSADLFSFLTPASSSNLWGWAHGIFGRFESAETTLFPGALLLIFSLHYLFKIAPVKVSEAPGKPRRLVTLIDAIALLLFTLILLISLTGGTELSMGPTHLSIHSPSIPSSILILLLLLRVLLQPGSWPGRLWRSAAIEQIILSAIFFLGLIFSFYAPFLFLAKIFPPFENMRVSARLIVLSIFSLSLWGGVSISSFLAARGNQGRRRLFAILLTLGILGEFMAVPVAFNNMAPPIPGSAPEIYSRIQQKEAGVIAELPFYAEGISPCYILYSTLHWKNLVNGYSGIIPRYYEPLSDLLEDFPSKYSLRALRDFQVDYVVIHWRYMPDLRCQSMRKALEGEDALCSEGEWGGSELYRVVKERLPESGEVPLSYQEIPRDKWKLEAPSLHGLWEGPGSAIDGKTGSYWSTGRPASKGDSFTIDMGEENLVAAVALSLGTDFRAWPRSYVIETSPDGSLWREACHEDESYPPFSSYFKNPRDPVFITGLPSVKARFIRMTLTRGSSVPWGAHEIRLYGRALNESHNRI